jgi:hypothetical protein
VNAKERGYHQGRGHLQDFTDASVVPSSVARIARPIVRGINYGSGGGSGGKAKGGYRGKGSPMGSSVVDPRYGFGSPSSSVADVWSRYGKGSGHWLGSNISYNGMPMPLSPSSSSASQAFMPSDHDASIPFDVRTLVIRNIPIGCTPAQLLALWPPQGLYNLLHLPYSNRQHRTVGYAFINFTSREALLWFSASWSGCILRSDAKALDIRIAEVQGFEGNIEHMRQSGKIRSISDPDHMPIIILPDGSFADFKAVMETGVLPDTGMVPSEFQYGQRSNWQPEVSKQQKVAPAGPFGTSYHVPGEQLMEILPEFPYEASSESGERVASLEL